MLIDKICLICGKEYQVPHWRKDKSKYCSVDCQRTSLKAAPNLICPICGKHFHRKPYHIKRCKGDLGFCCSKSCDTELRKTRMSGENNHQYGLKGKLNASFIDRDLLKKNNRLNEQMVYVGDWYKKYNTNGRVTKHRYLVELNYYLFDESFFVEIENWFYLKKGYVVHHIDNNHNNNELSNLQVLTRGEHSRLHNKLNKIKRNQKGQFIKKIKNNGVK